MTSKNKLNIKAVIFDMDGVITDTMPYHYQAWKIVFEKIDIHVTHLDIYIREGQTGEKALIEIFEKYEKPYNAEIIASILKNKESTFKRIVKKRFIIGARSFIKNLHKNGFQLGLVTGTAYHELLKILPPHLFNKFDVIVTGTDVKRGKPHPEPYLKALKKLNVKPQDAVVIENAPSGIESAKCAGCLCLALETSLKKQYLLQADYVYQSIKALQHGCQFILKAG